MATGSAHVLSFCSEYILMNGIERFRVDINRGLRILTQIGLEHMSVSCRCSGWSSSRINRWLMVVPTDGESACEEETAWLGSAAQRPSDCCCRQENQEEERTFQLTLCDTQAVQCFDILYKISDLFVNDEYYYNLVLRERLIICQYLLWRICEWRGPEQL